MPAVDLVVNTFERTYRTVLAPGFFDGLAEQNRFGFARRVALVNNVDDRADAHARAARLVAAGELDAVLDVAEHLDAALATTGLERRDLGRIPHYSDCALVAVCSPGAPWLAYWDADVVLREPADWITPSVALLERDPRVLVANPNDATFPEPSAATVAVTGDGFALGRGFSDQLFLVRRAELARPVYGERTLAALRNPAAHVARVFEARVEDHMRRHGRLRALHLGSAYVHPPSRPALPSATPRERARRARNQAVLAALRAVPPAARPARLRDV